MKKGDGTGNASSMQATAISYQKNPPTADEARSVPYAGGPNTGLNNRTKGKAKVFG